MMKIVPVLDLKGGLVVHARRGRRADYAPLSSPLVDGSEPVAVARALCSVCRASTAYVADLDALAGGPVNEADPDGAGGGRGAVGRRRRHHARAGGGARARRRGAQRRRHRVDRPGRAGGGRGKRRRATARPQRRPARRPADLARSSSSPAAPRRPRRPWLGRLDVRELLVIDLARVGSGSGPPLDAVAELARALPNIAIYAGGGVRDDADLRALEAAGAAGALVATALHEGRITP